MHDPQHIKKVYASYVLDYGDGYDRQTFIQYIACTLFNENERQVAADALRQVASNINGRKDDTINVHRRTN